MNSDVSKSSHTDHAEYARQELVINGLDKEWEVVVATPYTIQIDIDSKELPETFHRLLGILEERTGSWIDYSVSTSKSGNKHVILTLPNSMDVYDRIAWQAIFGSDPIREAVHLVSVMHGERNPILLFQRKFAGQLTAGEVPKQLVGE
jgi:hypothetical protein